MREEETQRILQEHRFRQKKSLGQHFLHDSHILEEIVRISGAADTDGVLEIGAGAGTLTRRLSCRARQVLAVEVDRSLIPVLEESLTDLPNVRVRFGDFLRVPWGEITDSLGEGSVRVVANIPYAITTEIVERLLQARPMPVSATLLVQKEAAQRMLAVPGGKDYGPLSVCMALYTQSTLAMEVPPSAFVPPPHVDSAVLHIRFLKEEAWPGCPREDLDRLVHVAFRSRRKQIHNNIAALFPDQSSMLDALEQAGLRPSLRAEQITPEEYALLAGILAQARHK